MIAISTAVRCSSSLEKALQDIAGTGLRTIDLLVIDGWVHVNTSNLSQRWDETTSKLDNLFNTYRLKPIALNTGVGPQLHDRSAGANHTRRQETEALIRLMKRHQIGIAAIQPRNADKERPWEEVLADCIATLKEQVDMGQAAGVTFALELHINSPFETLEQARQLLERLPDLPLVYDPSHFVMQGIDIKETGWLMDHTKHVHLRDAAKGKLQTPLGEGEVDFDWVLSSLNDRGYRGHVSIEYLEDKSFDSLESAVRLYEQAQHHFPKSS